MAARALAARGHEVHVVVDYQPAYFAARETARMREYPREERDGDVRVHVRCYRPVPVVERWLEGLGHSLALARVVRQLHRQHQFDVVEFPNFEGLGLIATLFSVAPIVVRLHTSTYEYVELCGRPPRVAERFQIWAEQTSARRARAVVTHSVAQRAKHLPLCGVSEIAIVPHGIEVPMAVPSAERELAVLIVGGLNVRKGADTLLAAIPRVLAAVPGAEFWLAGGGKNEQYEQRFRAAHPEISPAQVRFLGFVEPEELAALYARCAVHASASVHESFGLTFIEAMARATPVVGCNVSAIPEIVRHEVNGLLVPPHDPQAFAEAIVRLLRDPELRARLGRAGRQRVSEEYSLPRLGQNLEYFFRHVAESTSSRPEESS